MRIRTAKGYESRAFSPSGSYTWNDSLQWSGIVPPHGFSTLNKAGVNITERNVTQAGPVNACLRIIANNMLFMGPPRPYTLAYDESGNAYHQPVAPIPSLLLNPYGTACRPSEGMVQTIYSMGLFGEVFLLTLTRDEMGDPQTLEILPTPLVDAHRDGNGNATYALYLGAGSSQSLDPADVTHIRLRARPGALRAASSMQEEALGYAMYLAAVEYGLQFFGQGVHSSFVLTTPNKLGQDVVDRIIARLTVAHTGLNMSHLPLLFDSGITPQKMQITPDEAQFLLTQTTAVDGIAAYFGLPSEWIGGSPNPNSLGKTLEEQQTWFAQNTMTGYVNPHQEAMSEMLPRGVECAYNTRKLTRADSGNFAKELLSIRTGTIMTPDEVRLEFYDMGPLPNGAGANADAPLASNQSPMSGSIMGGDSGGQ